jgi:hypothetical protein
VRGPDGIRFQSRFASIDSEAETHDEVARGEEPFVPELGHGRAVKLVGTNMAIRREALANLGGFDPTFRYYLEDGDLALRLSGEGLRIAVVPTAEVHHALAASPTRSGRRVPRTLFDIGRSTAVFLRRHSGANPDDILHRIKKREEQRVLRAMILGFLEPRDVPRLAKTLEDGWREGMRAELAEPQLSPSTGSSFEPFPVASPGHAVIACRRLQKSAGLARAKQITALGKARASLFCFSLTRLPQKVRYTDEGVWLQIGGQFAGPDPSRRPFRWCRFANRVDSEFRRVAKRRGLNEGVHVEKLASSRFFGVGIW